MSEPQVEDLFAIGRRQARDGETLDELVDRIGRVTGREQRMALARAVVAACEETVRRSDSIEEALGAVRLFKGGK